MNLRNSFIGLGLCALLAARGDSPDTAQAPPPAISEPRARKPAEGHAGPSGPASKARKAAGPQGRWAAWPLGRLAAWPRAPLFVQQGRPQARRRAAPATAARPSAISAQVPGSGTWVTKARISPPPKVLLWMLK
jgi:hypothetical protein